MKGVRRWSGGPFFKMMKEMEHPWVIAFLLMAALIIWLCIKINEDDEPET